MNAKKHSAFLKLAITFIVFYSVYNICFFAYNAYSFRDQSLRRKSAFLIDQMRISATYMRMNDLATLRLYLDDNISAHSVDFYMIGKDSNYIQKNTEYVPPEMLVATEKNKIIFNDSLEILRLEEGGATLVLGNFRGPKHFVRNLFLDNKAKFIEDILFVFLCFFGFVAYYFRNIIQIYRALLRRDRSLLKNIVSGSIESDLLLGALGGYETTLKKNSEKNTLLGNQILPALQHELNSGRKPPYDFFVVMARTDINQFSTIFNRFSRDPFMDLINDFFLQCAEIIARYDGLVHGYAGDEVIYYFKQEGSLDPYALAAGAIREINALAESISERTMKERGYPFLVKSSLAGGELRFGRLVNGYSVAGAPFIESVRIMSEITEKEHNTLYYGAATAENLKQICDSKFEKSVRLKGFDQEVSLYSYSKHKRTSFLQEQLPLLAYRRSEAELESVFSWLDLKGSAIPLPDFLLVLRGLGGCKLLKPLPRVLELYTKLLNFYSSKENEHGDEYRLSALLSLARNFVPKDNFSALASSLENCLRNKDRRVVSNAVDLLAFYNPEHATQELYKLEDHRISASVLVKDGLVRLSDSLTKKIGVMLRSENAAQIASALFAIGEIAKHYRETDPVYLSTRLNFLRILKQLPGYVEHENAMVSRQALLAAKKYSDEAIELALHSIWEQSEDELVLERFAEIFNWKKVQVQKLTKEKKRAA